jgi:Gram-negative bacterial TonB protein C-terminal
MTTFRAPVPLQGPVPKAVRLRASVQARPPELSVDWHGKHAGWWSSLGVLWNRPDMPTLREPLELFAETPVAAFRFPQGSVAASILLHAMALMLLPILLALPGGQASNPEFAVEQPQTIYYRLTTHEPFEKLPHIAPKGAGGQPGAGELQSLLAKLGSTAEHRRVIIVSKPVRPDNKHQTIFQPATPPDLKITMDLKLPNVIGGTSAMVPKPQIHFNARASKPNQAHRVSTAATAPSLANASPVRMADPTIAQPHLAVPINAEGARPMPTRSMVTTATEPSLTSDSGVVGFAELTLSPTSGPAAPGVDADEKLSATNGGVPTSGDGSGLVVIGLDPAQAASLANLPAGNRSGEFSIAPGGGGGGSPGGSVGGAANAGSAGNATTAGGDRSAGLGAGNSGGGAGKSGTTGTLSISGNAGGSSAGALDPTIIRNMVYPVPSTLVLRRNALIVSAGPMGGGGLNVYGALQCGKIYTVFLPMPGKGWTLQFCQSGASAAKPNAQGSSTVIHMQQGLIPPDVESRFDFRRMPVPFEKKNKPIVLKGVIKEDGTLDGLQVFQSIVPQMDEAARVAFSKWKFKPAMKEGKPVSVDILVGIPTEPPVDRAQ